MAINIYPYQFDPLADKSESKSETFEDIKNLGDDVRLQFLWTRVRDRACA